MKSGAFDSVKCDLNYFQAVLKSGYIPVMVPLIEDLNVNEYLDMAEALILTGGEDVDTFMYNENPCKELKKTNTQRDELEKRLFKGAIEKNIKIIGICRGMQLINVLLGGTLFQHIQGDIRHRDEENPERITEHYIKIKDKKSILYENFQKDEIIVNSWHHQAVKDLGSNLKITSVAQDGIIESFESFDGNILGFQFHPEKMERNKEEFLQLIQRSLQS